MEADTDTTPNEFPVDDDGAPDYDQAAAEMDFADASPVRPTYISDGAEVMAVVGRSRDGASVLVAPPDALHGQTRSVAFEDLWNEWMHGELLYRKRRFLYVEEETYNTEAEVAISQLAVAELADHAAELLEEWDVPELQDAVDEVYAELGYDPEESDS